MSTARQRIFWFVVIIILALVLYILYLSNFVYALDCKHDKTPFITRQIPLLENLIYWDCVASNMTDYSCVSWIKDNESSLLQVNPIHRRVEVLGIVQHFNSKNMKVNVNFRPELNVIRSGVNYTFGVDCSDGTKDEIFSANVQPRYKEFDVVGQGITRGIDQSVLIFGLLLVLTFVIAPIVYLTRRRK